MPPWLALFDRPKRKSLVALRALLSPDVIDLQDEWGMTATHFAVMDDWAQGLDVLLAAKPDLTLHYFRTGETALHLAVGERKPHLVTALLEGGANADRGNYWAVTPRQNAVHAGLAELFAGYPEGEVTVPPPRIQNAEHLADHFHPKFKIPARAERASLAAGQAVDLMVYGPAPERVKVRITAAGPRYTATVESPANNLAPGTTEVTFGPENVCTVYIKR